MRSGPPKPRRPPAPRFKAFGKPKSPPLVKVEAFGKPRDPSSNAAKAERLKESRRMEKALAQEHHGENIFAYVHIGTGQVVYSLTRVMNNNHILPQLVFHGKKTVPSSLRRDLWTPYFSLHFPSSYSGLIAYHQLRELSLQRQLAAPEYLVMTTKQKANRTMRERMSLEEELNWDNINEGQEHPDGIPRMMERKERAKVLMMQRATSVADVAFVLDTIQREGHLRSASSVQEFVQTRRAQKLLEASKRGKKKLRRRWMVEKEIERKYERMRMQVQEGTKWGLEMYTAKRIATEHDGIVVDPYLGRARVMLPRRNKDEDDREALQSDTNTNTKPDETLPEIHILWTDMRDSTYAERWPDFVAHGELERMAVSRRARGPADPAGPSTFTDRTVHVIGGMKMGPDDWMRGLGGENKTNINDDGSDSDRDPATNEVAQQPQ